MKKVLKVLVASMLALMLTFGVVPSAMADPSEATETPSAAITKILKVPFGTTLPASMDFEFKIEALSYNDSAQDKGMVPPIGNVTVTFNTTNTADHLIGTDDGISTYYMESGELFTVANFVGDYKRAGVYEYELTEVGGTYSPSDPLFTEEVKYSKAVYNVRVYVKENSSGILEVTHIGAVMTYDDDGVAIAGSEQSKVNVEPGTGKPGDQDFSYSELIFTNAYEKTKKPTVPGNPDPTDPDDWTLSISKTVKGSLVGSTSVFDFVLTLDIPSLIDGKTKTCEGQVVEAILTGTVITGYKVVDAPIDFESGEPTSFSLSHNQFLVFVDAPIGTSYEVKELRSAGFTPELTVTYNSTKSPIVQGVLNTDLATDGKVAASLLFVGEGGSSTDYINDAGTITLTGLNISDLPFYGLILLAVGSLVALAVLKSRKRKEESN